MTLGDRFWAKVDVGDPQSCWLWRASTKGNGYGQINVGGRIRLAHRTAWELTYEAIPRGMCVCHACDTPSCVNPAHLFLGTRADNMQDCFAKGRGRYGPGGRHRSGESNPSARLTDAEVEAIRSEYGAGLVTQGQLARDHGTSPSHISMIVNGKTRTSNGVKESAL